MPFQIEYDDETGFVIEAWTGRLTVEDALESIEERHRHPRFDASTPRLIDLSGVDESPSWDDVRALAHMHSSSTSRGPCALVAPSDLQFGVSRMFEGHAQGTRAVGVFRDRACAMKWLEEHHEPSTREAAPS